jgi:DNA-binding IclR family transcriptional regulator
MSVRSAARVLDLIEWLTQQKQPVSLADASKVLDLPKSSTLLLLRTLVERGYLARQESRYTLIRLPGEPSADQPAWNTILRIAEPILIDAVDKVGESGFLAVLTSEFKIHYLNKILPRAQELKYDRNITVDRVPHHVASGLALLAKLPETVVEEYLGSLTGRDELKSARTAVAKTRREGVAVNLAGRVEGAAGVGAAIMDAEGRPIGAINLAGPASRVQANLENVVKVAKAAAANVSREWARRTPKRRSSTVVTKK